MEETRGCEEEEQMKKEEGQQKEEEKGIIGKASARGQIN